MRIATLARALRPRYPSSLRSRILVALAAVFSRQSARRAVAFNVQMLPLLCSYKWVQWRLPPGPEKEARYRALHRKFANRPLHVALRMEGFYIKIAQVVSSFGDTAVPKEFVESLSVLQDRMPAKPPAYVRALIERELGAPIATLFQTFDDNALAAASIGQVHRATLADGTAVAVKVQYPNAKRLFKMDLGSFRRFCQLAMPEYVSLIDEIERQFMSEFDYRVEAALLRQAAANMQPFCRSVAVPLPLDAAHPRSPLPSGCCTERVLCMEWLEGRSLLSAQKAQLRALAARRGVPEAELGEELKRRWREGTLRGIGPPPLLRDLYRAALVASDAAYNAAAGAHNAAGALARCVGCEGAPSVAFRQTEPPLDVTRLVALIFRVHGEQILSHGFFNGDPHPGNLMLMPDGRVGLLDWGQVKRLELGPRLQLARLLIALADRDEVMTAQLWHSCGFRTRLNHPWTLNRYACWRFSRFTPDVVDDLGGVLNFERTLAALDPVLTDPDEFVMVFRTSALLRGNALGLGDLYADTARHWRAQAAALLRRHGEPRPRTVRGRRAPRLELGRDEVTSTSCSSSTSTDAVPVGGASGERAGAM